MTSGKKIRVSILLVILGLVSLDAWLTRVRSTDWDSPLRLTVYPIAADNSEAARKYVAELRREDFTDLETFLAREARRYGVAASDPLRVRLGPVLNKLPPAPPADRNLLGTVWWSLKLRAWSWRAESGQSRPYSQVRVFVLYYDPETTPSVAHSLGVRQGMIGVVHAFASRSMASSNNMVIAHELLHTLAATDKYQPDTGLPRFPEGYAEPQRQPRYPQDQAELMGGRIPLSADHAEIPQRLNQVLIGPVTAREIGWVNPS